MFTDVAGFSRMMGRNEEATVATIDELNSLMTPLIQARGGTILKFIGDAVLATFDSASNAVDCAVSIQKTLAARNVPETPDKRVLIRIGVHVGDVVVREKDIFGDGVNIAARIQPLAEPGGICISQMVYDLIKARPEIKTSSLGPRLLKNIEQPVSIYKVFVEPQPTDAPKTAAVSLRRAIKWAIPALLATAAASRLWRNVQLTRSSPDMFTIAVAPFQGSSEQAKMEADLMRALVKQKLDHELGLEKGVSILVEDIAKAPRSHAEAKQLGEKAGADVVVWGDVLVLRNEVEIQPYLTLVKPILYASPDDPTALHSSPNDPLALRSKLDQPQQLDIRKTKAKELGNLALMVAAKYHVKKGNLDAALSLLQRISPESPESLIEQGYIYYMRRMWDKNEELLKQALVLAPGDLRARSLLAFVRFYRGRGQQAVADMEALVASYPRSHEAHQMLGAIDVALGRFDAAIPHLKKAIILDPQDVLPYSDLGQIYYRRGDYAQAAEQYRAVAEVAPSNLYGHLFYYITLRRAGRTAEADRSIRETADALKAFPQGSSEWPGPVALFYAGRIGEENLLLTARNGNADISRGRECETYYYLGISHRMKGSAADEAQAREYFQKSVATGLRDYYEYMLSEFELQEVRKP